MSYENYESEETTELGVQGSQSEVERNKDTEMESLKKKYEDVMFRYVRGIGGFDKDNQPDTFVNVYSCKGPRSALSIDRAPANSTFYQSFETIEQFINNH